MNGTTMLLVAGIAIAMLVVPAALEGAGINVPSAASAAEAASVCVGHYEHHETPSGTTSTCSGPSISV